MWTLERVTTVFALGIRLMVIDDDLEMH